MNGRRLVDSLQRPAAFSAADRLTALRDRTGSSVGTTRAARRRDVLIGMAVILVGVIAVFAFILNRPSGVAPQVGQSDTPAPVVTNAPRLLAGEAFIPLSVEFGHFPPQLQPGDFVRIAVTPGVEGNGETRVLVDEAVVTGISPANELSSTTVITVRGPQQILSSIASSGPLFLALVEGDLE